MTVRDIARFSAPYKGPVASLVFPENRLYSCGWKLMVEAFSCLPIRVNPFLCPWNILHKQYFSFPQTNITIMMIIRVQI